MSSSPTKKHGANGWVDLVNMPKYKEGALKGSINWISSINCELPFMYKNISGSFIITDYDPKAKIIDLLYGEKIYQIPKCYLYSDKFGSIFNSKTPPLSVTHPQLKEYFVSQLDFETYSYGSGMTTEIQCPLCGFSKTMIVQIFVKYSFSCNRCGDGISYPNKFMMSLLSQLGIECEAEKYFDWCKFKMDGKSKRGLYDFYFLINSTPYIVEMDGEFHYVNRFSGKRAVEQAQFIDRKKDGLANDNGIKVIRINCFKSDMNFIKNNIFKSELSSIIDLSNVDWLLCDRMAQSNKVKEVCEIWNTQTKVVQEIIPVVGLSKGTIVRYLKRGREFGWCDYMTPSEKKTDNMEKAYSLWKTGLYKQVEISKIIKLHKDTVGRYIKEMNEN